MDYLRFHSNIISCILGLGRGPWDELEKVIIIYPISLTPDDSRQIIIESLPVLHAIYRALSATKLVSLTGKSFEDLYLICCGLLNA